MLRNKCRPQFREDGGPRQKCRKDGKPFAKTENGYRLLRDDNGAPYYMWVGKKNVQWETI